MCGGFAPFAIDAYVPGLPQIAAELHTSASTVQLTLTAFLLAVGLTQLVVGPLSDQVGRRRLLLVGTAGAAVASVVCAMAQTIEILVLGRLLQGAFGAAGIVLSRAIVADYGKGLGLARSFALLVSIQSIAPVIAPVVGGALITPFGWRSVFWFLAVLCSTLFVSALMVVPETLPAERRATGGIRPALRSMVSLLRTPAYISLVAMLVSTFAVMFAYNSASSFVLQRIVGLSTTQYSLVFAVNSSTLLIAALVNRRILSVRVTPFMVVTRAAIVTAVAVAWLVVAVLVLDVAGWAVLLGFFVLVAANGFLFPNISALAIGSAGGNAGSASALMGAAQMTIAAGIAPLTGIGDGRTAVPMVAVMVVGTALMLIAFVVARRSHGPAAV